MSEKYYSLTQLKSIMRTEGNQWTGPYERIHPDDLKKLKPADVRPVVYCRDCEHSQDGFICDSPFHGGMTFPNDFCSRGIRREGGADG